MRIDLLTNMNLRAIFANPKNYIEHLQMSSILKSVPSFLLNIFQDKFV